MFDCCCVLVIKCFVRFVWCNEIQPFQKPQILPNIFPKVSYILKIFLGKCEMNFCLLFGQHCFLPWNSPIRCSSDFTMGSSVTTWISCPCWSNFGGPDTSGKVHHGPKFSPFVDKNIPLKFSSLLLYIIYWGLANSKMLHYRHHLVWSVDQNVKKKRKERKSKKNNKKKYIKKHLKNR